MWNFDRVLRAVMISYRIQSPLSNGICSSSALSAGITSAVFTWLHLHPSAWRLPPACIPFPSPVSPAFSSSIPQHIPGSNSTGCQGPRGAGSRESEAGDLWGRGAAGWGTPLGFSRNSRPWKSTGQVPWQYFFFWIETVPLGDSTLMGAC